MTQELQPETSNTPENTGRPSRPGTQRNHFFHFDGTRIASWFPSFSVEVVHAGLTVSPHPQPQTENSRIEAMAHQLQDIFPNVPMSTIVTDLQRTHSLELTTENILESQILVPPAVSSPSSEEAPEQAPVETTVSTTEPQQSQDNELQELLDNLTSSTEESKHTEETLNTEDDSENRNSPSSPQTSEGTTAHHAPEEVEENPENVLENQQNLTIRQRMVLAAKRRMQRR